MSDPWSRVEVPYALRVTVFRFREPDDGKEVKSVPFGLDLMYWGEKREVAQVGDGFPSFLEHRNFVNFENGIFAQVPMNNADCHRFWRPPDEG